MILSCHHDTTNCRYNGPDPVKIRVTLGYRVADAIEAVRLSGVIAAALGIAAVFGPRSVIVAPSADAQLDADALQFAALLGEVGERQRVALDPVGRERDLEVELAA